MNASTNLIKALVDKAQCFSRSIASLLSVYEHVHSASGEMGQRLRADFIAIDEFLEHSLIKKWREGPYGLKAQFLDKRRPLEAAENWLSLLEHRLVRITLRAWVEQVRPDKNKNNARRPDVLALTCQMLSNPNAPHTYEIARFAVVLTLRALYDVAYSADSLEKLRNAYDELVLRFNEQQRRRQQRKASSHENLLLDALALEGWIHRSLSGTNLSAYYNGFIDQPLGVSPGGRRGFASEREWPELSGELPDFASILNILFTQPVFVPGIDEVTGGLLATIPAPNREQWSGGLVSLIAGPPGSGKTSLCLAITSRMAELGSIVRYIATEEAPHSLNAKRTTTGRSVAMALSPDSTKGQEFDLGDFQILDGAQFENIQELSKQLTAEFKIPNAAVQPEAQGSGHLNLYLVFPRVLVIDSLNALLQLDTAGSLSHQEQESYSPGEEEPSDIRARRKTLARILQSLRELGVCVFLAGDLKDSEDQGLAFLVDNVFTLTQEDEISRRHPTRIFTVQKTRLQTSHRGRHVFHLHGSDNCAVSPSLHSVLRSVRGRPVVASDPNARAILWSNRPKQLSLPGMGSQEVNPITIRANAHTLVYGHGPAGKARLGLWALLEPRVQGHDWEQYVAVHSEPERKLLPFEERHLSRSRVLVVSFLYEKAYYEDIIVSLLQRRFGLSRTDAQQRMSTLLTVLDFYPGFTDPETLVARVRKHLRGGRLDGAPYTAVLIDGIHNILLQFPLLEKDPLLWPTLYRLLRSEGIDTISTFTFFQTVRVQGNNVVRPVDAAMVRNEMDESTLKASQNLFFHLLVSSCDYSLVAETPINNAQADRSWVRVRVASSIDGFGKNPVEFWWDPREMRYRHET